VLCSKNIFLNNILKQQISQNKRDQEIFDRIVAPPVCYLQATSEAGKDGLECERSDYWAG
jgi:hypothetical protein